jgi:hypothetical protein
MRCAIIRRAKAYISIQILFFLQSARVAIGPTISLTEAFGEIKG